MANDIRLRANGVSGQLDTADLAVGTTTMTSAALADLPAVDSSHHAAITLFRRNAAGRVTQQEIVWVTAHTAAATSATIVRGQEGTTAQTWNGVTTPQDYWVHADTAADYPVITATGAPSTGTSYFKGQLALSQDGHTYVCTAVGSPGTWVDITAAFLPLAGGTITEANPAVIPLKVKAAASQSVDLIQVQDSTGAALGGLAKDGALWSGGTGPFARLSITAVSATDAPVRIRGAVGQSVNLVEWQNSSGTAVASIDQNGSMLIGAAGGTNQVAVNDGFIANTSFYANAGTAGRTPFVARGVTSQTGDLQQWQSSAAAVLAKITASGGFGFSPATTTTAPGAGGAGALPATPAGYATVTINGVDRKIPYY